MTLYINESSGETRLESENMFPAEHLNVTVHMEASVTHHNFTAFYINEGWQYSQKGSTMLGKVSKKKVRIF